MTTKLDRLTKLEEQLNHVCCLMKFMREELGTEDFQTLLKFQKYCTLVDMQGQLYGEIKSIHKELDGDPILTK